MRNAAICFVLLFLTACTATDYRESGSGKPKQVEQLTFAFSGSVIDTVDYFGQKGCHKEEFGSYTGIAVSQDNLVDPESEEYQRMCDEWGGKIDQQRITAIRVMVDDITLLESECIRDFNINRQVTLLYENPMLTLKSNDRIGGIFTTMNLVKHMGENYKDYINAVSPSNLVLPATENLQDESLVIKGTPLFRSTTGAVLGPNAAWITGIETDPKAQANAICEKENQRLIDFYKEKFE